MMSRGPCLGRGGTGENFPHPPPPPIIISIKWLVGPRRGQGHSPPPTPAAGPQSPRADRAVVPTSENRLLPDAPDAVDGAGQGHVWDKLCKQVPRIPGTQGGEDKEHGLQGACGQTRRVWVPAPRALLTPPASPGQHPALVSAGCSVGRPGPGAAEGATRAQGLLRAGFQVGERREEQDDGGKATVPTRAAALGQSLLQRSGQDSANCPEVGLRPQSRPSLRSEEAPGSRGTLRSWGAALVSFTAASPVLRTVPGPPWAHDHPVSPWKKSPGSQDPQTGLRGRTPRAPRGGKSLEIIVWLTGSRTFLSIPQVKAFVSPTPGQPQPQGTALSLHRNPTLRLSGFTP